MASIYQNAEMLIYPSIFEGFGIPILEALYSKIPVITSKDGCFQKLEVQTQFISILIQKRI
jgi:glycosyltransferase involved in cell wall biosynthesis